MTYVFLYSVFTLVANSLNSVKVPIKKKKKKSKFEFEGITQFFFRVASPSWAAELHHSCSLSSKEEGEKT